MAIPAGSVAPESSPCFICGQLRADPDNDLIERSLRAEAGGATNTPGAYARRVIAEDEFFAVIPSLGPLNDSHCLVCPKRHVASLASLSSELEPAYRAMTSHLTRLLRLASGGEVYRFEHGTACGAAQPACSVSHAHLHVLSVPEPFDLIAETGLAWHRFDGSLQALTDQTRGGEYLLATTPDERSYVCRAEATGFESQYLRRVFAARLGVASRWNWRESPRAQQVDGMWKSLSRLSRADGAGRDLSI